MTRRRKATQAALIGLLLVLLIVSLGVLWLFPGPASSSPGRKVDASLARASWAPIVETFVPPRKAPRRARSAVSAPKVETPPIPEEPKSIEGDTAFQRRLVAGEEARELQKRLDDTWASITGTQTGVPAELEDMRLSLAGLSAERIQELAGAFETFRPAIRNISKLLLTVETERRLDRVIQRILFQSPDVDVQRSPRVERETTLLAMASFLHGVLHPPADVDALRLTTTSKPEDRLGTGALVRCWTRKSSWDTDVLSASEMRGGEWVLHSLCEFSDWSIPEGLDVLVTPELGVDVFPHKVRYPWAAGLYHPRDRFCSVQSGVARWYRQLVLKHEIAHAFLFQFTPEFSELTFVHEGLAEYLRNLGSGDVGLQVPVERFRDNFAALQSMIQRLREHALMEDVDPTRFLLLEPDEFYALYELSYRVAEAAMVFIGPSIVEQAVKERKDEAIVAAVENIQWTEFLEFVEKHADHGNPERAAAIDEGEDLIGKSRPSRGKDEAVQPADVLESIGVRAREGSSIEPSLLKTAHSERSDQESLVLVEEEMRQSTVPVIFLTDVSPAMDEQLSSRRSRMDFVADYLQKIEAERKRLRRQPIVRELALDVPAVVPNLRFCGRRHFTVTAAPAWLDAANRGQANLVLCLGGPDLPLRERLEREGVNPDGGITSHDVAVAYRNLFREVKLSLRCVLVIDVGGRESDARALASGIAASRGQGTLIVYWKPKS